MKYLVNFSGAFLTQQEAVAFINFIESIKTKIVKNPTDFYKYDTPVNRSCKVWSTMLEDHDASPSQLILEVNFDSPIESHSIDGDIPLPNILTEGE